VGAGGTVLAALIDKKLSYAVWFAVAVILAALITVAIRRGWPWRPFVAGLATAALLMLGITALRDRISDPHPRSGANPPTSAGPSTTSPPPTASPVAAQAASITISTPKQGDHVSIKGTAVEGRIDGDLGAKQLWLFVYASDNRVHYLTGQVDVSDGAFGVNTGQLGSTDPSEAGIPYKIEIVVADAAASGKIRALRPDANGDIKIAKLPTGAVIQASVLIYRR
jgi:hypothetical protein